MTADRRPRVLVLGDVMLDRSYQDARPDHEETWERGVRVVRRPLVIDEPGGAGNVAANIVALGGDVTLVGCIGAWDDARREALGLHHALFARDVYSSHILPAGGSTTVIHRLRRGPDLLARWDTGYPAPTPDAIRRASDLLRGYDLLVISDYGRGVCGVRGEQLHEHRDQLAALLERARNYAIPVLCHTKRLFAWQEYAGVTALVQTSAELRVMCPEQPGPDDVARLLQVAGMEHVVQTQGHGGFWHYDPVDQLDGIGTHQPAIHAGPCLDAVGAGDTLLAALAVGWGFFDPDDLRFFAASAAAIAVTKVGTATVSRQEVLRLMERLMSESDDTTPPLAGRQS